MRRSAGLARLAASGCFLSMLFMALCLLFGPFGAMALAADQNVDSTGTNPVTPGTLPYAVVNVGVGENVIFQPAVVGQTINLSSDLDVLRSMNFVNSSTGAVTTDIGGGSMNVATGSTISIDSGLTWQTTTTGVISARTIYGANSFSINGLNGTIIATSEDMSAFAVKVESGTLSITGGMSGTLTGISNTGTANGLHSLGDVSITGGLSGDISNTTASTSTGIFGNNSVSITGDLSGNIVSNSTGGTAYGLMSNGIITLNNGLSGDVSATTGTANAMALRAINDITITGALSGNVSANSSSGGAWGLYCTGGDITLNDGLSGNVSATSVNAAAYGIEANGTLNGGDTNTPVSISGSVIANGATAAAAIQGGQINLRLEDGGTLSAVSSGGAAYESKMQTSRPLLIIDRP